MKTTKSLLPLMLITIIILFTSGIAIGAVSVESTGTSSITVDPNAAGTKLFGPLTIYYERTGVSGGCATERANLIFFARLKKGVNIYGFSGRANYICIEDTAAQEHALNNFVAQTVIPFLYPNKPNAPFALKSVDQIVTDDQLIFSGSPYFTILDIELAVKE